MIREDQYAGLCMEVKALQKKLAEAEKEVAKYKQLYGTEKKAHEETKIELKWAIRDFIELVGSE